MVIYALSDGLPSWSMEAKAAAVDRAAVPAAAAAMETSQAAPPAQNEPGASMMLSSSGLAAHEVAAGVGWAEPDATRAVGAVPAVTLPGVTATRISAQEAREAADLFGLSEVVSDDFFMIEADDLLSCGAGVGASPNHSEATQEDAEPRHSPRAESWHAVAVPDVPALAQVQPAGTGPFEAV